MLDGSLVQSRFQAALAVIVGVRAVEIAVEFETKNGSVSARPGNYLCNFQPLLIQIRVTRADFA